jgi:hypothetical protein
MSKKHPTERIYHPRKGHLDFGLRQRSALLRNKVPENKYAIVTRVQDIVAEEQGCLNNIAVPPGRLHNVGK